jgi:protein-S-isoprenylcysteine O-methyltransferase Ste14
MATLRTVTDVVWIAFWLFWLASAVGVKRGSASTRRRIPLVGGTALAVFLIVRVFRGGGTQVHSIAAGAIGTAMFAFGLGLAIWARLHLGRNWGMPMTQKDEPELVTSGPYRFVRHPIYSGLLLAVFGTALVNDLRALFIALILGGYFYYSATVEERNLSEVFPVEYPKYRTHTKKLIPFVL